MNRRSAARVSLPTPLACLLLVTLFPCLVRSPALAASRSDGPAEAEGRSVYVNRLQPIERPRPLLADWPEFVHPIREQRHFEAPPLIRDANATLSLRAWRYSYHSRGIVEMNVELDGQQTAVVVVHPWGIEDGQGWREPEPAGTAFFCTPLKNAIYHQHVKKVLSPFLTRVRPHVALVLYSLPGRADEIRSKLYRTTSGRPTRAERRKAAERLRAVLTAYRYRAGSIPERIEVDRRQPTAAYFRLFPGLDAGEHFNGKGFWDLPIPVDRSVKMNDEDVVFFDGQGYSVLRQFLKDQGIRHVLLAGYATDMCVCSTTAGYENLIQDFNVFLVGDATLATFPASESPACATTAAIAKASLKLFVTQVSAILIKERASRAQGRASRAAVEGGSE